MNNSKIKTINIVIISICVIAIIPMIWLAIYSRPCVDDYSYSAQTYHIIKRNDYNIFKLIIEALKVDFHFYKSWQGLYSSAFILALQPGIFGEQYYFIGAWVLILLMFSCLYFFIKTLLKDIMQIKGYSLLITFTLLTAILTGMPSPVQGIYWFNGAWNYMPFLFLTLLNISLLLRNQYLDEKNNVIFSTILSFIISGGNHVTAFLNIMILFIYSALTFKKNKAGSISLISAIIGFTIMYVAPGTFVRQSQLEKHGIIDTMLMSWKGYYFLIKNTISIQWIFIILTFMIFALYIYENTKIKSMKYNPILLIIVKTVIILGLLCVPYKAMGNFGAGRVTNVIWCTSLILDCILCIYTILWILFKYKICSKSKYDIIKNITLIILIIGICFFKNSNSVKATEDMINGNAKEFAISCDERYKIVRNSEEEIVYVEKLPEDEMLKFDDITTNKNDWRNKAWEGYYGKPTVIKLKY